MRRSGLDYQGPLVPDGKLHRVRASGDRARNSWFVLYPGSVLAGAYGCWKRQLNEAWCSRQPRELSAAEWSDVRRQWQQADLERRRTEAVRQAKARSTAQWLLDRSKPAGSHPYLERKGVRTHGELRHSCRGELIVPLRDPAGVLQSLQFIDPDGGKKFLGGGKVSGCYYTLANGADGPLVIAEGYATAASIYEATGIATVAAMNCGNLAAVASSLRKQYPERDIIIAADDDHWTDGNPGVTKATEAAQAIHARVAVPQFTNSANRSTDFNDLAAVEGLNPVKFQINSATRPDETPEQTVARLAALSPLEYDQCREAEAKRLGIRVTTLDAERFKRVPNNDADGDSTEPWPEPVNGCELLDALAGEFRRFLVLPPHGDTLLALWTLHSYSWQSCEYSPIVAITSPVRTCGKSRVLDVLEKIACNAFRTGNMSEAVLFRVLDSRQPTVLIDEFDTIPEDRRDALANILKHGFHRSGKVHRVEGEGTKEVVEFLVFGPKALACIKLTTLDAATVSRCINLRMQRKKPNVKVERLRRYDATDWVRKCIRWTRDHLSEIEAGVAAMPDALGDREQDIYEPLFVLANLAGGEWPQRVTNAALALSGQSMDANPEGSIQVLGAIRAYFVETDRAKVFSSALVKWLNEEADSTLATWNNGKGIRQAEIRRLLKEFDIQPRTVRIGDETQKGYDRAWFEEAFAAYLADPQTENSHTVTKPVGIGDSHGLAPVTPGECDRTKNTVSTNKDAGCDRVTVSNPEPAEMDLL